MSGILCLFSKWHRFVLRGRPVLDRNGNPPSRKPSVAPDLVGFSGPGDVDEEVEMGVWKR